MKLSKNKFGDMTQTQIKKWEKKTNSKVFFSDEKGIAFQKNKHDEDELLLVILIDGKKKPIILSNKAMLELRMFLNLEAPF